MKATHSLVIAILLVAIAACSGPDNSLEGKKKQLDEYKAELAELKGKINTLESEIEAEEGPKEIKRKPVKIQTVTTSLYKHPISLQGVIESDEDVQVSAEANGRAMKVYVEEGQQVSKGQLLVKIDDEVLRNSLAELQTAYDLAEQVFNKQERLWNQEIGSELDYLNAKNNKERLERQIATTRSRLAQTELRSPINGKVDQVMLNEGEMVAAGMPVVRVVDTRNINVVADVSERYLGSFKEGDSVDIIFPTLDKSAKGKIAAFGNVINPANRTFRMVVNVFDKEPWMKPNLLAKVQAYDKIVKDAIVIPTRVLHMQNDKQYVYTINENEDPTVAHKVEVKVAFTSTEETLIEEGLTPGQPIIVEGHSNLSEGEPVSIISE